MSACLISFERPSFSSVSVVLRCCREFIFSLSSVTFRTSVQSSLETALAANLASSNPCCSLATESNSGCVLLTYSSTSRLQLIEMSATSGKTGGGGISQRQFPVGSLTSTAISRVVAGRVQIEVEGRMKLRWLVLASTRRRTTVDEWGLILSTRYSRSSNIWTTSPGEMMDTFPLLV